MSVEDFQRRSSQAFWRDQRQLAHEWDQQVEEFNRMTGALSPVEEPVLAAAK